MYFAPASEACAPSFSRSFSSVSIDLRCFIGSHLKLEISFSSCLIIGIQLRYVKLDERAGRRRWSHVGGRSREGGGARARLPLRGVALPLERDDKLDLLLTSACARASTSASFLSGRVRVPA